MENDGSFSSRHFEFQPLAEGVYAAINRPEGWAIGNAGIVDLGERTVVYDTTMTPTAARDLRLASETLLGRQVDIVINSHYHNDHIWGNQAFSPATNIISTTRTRELIATLGQGEIKDYQDGSQGRLDTLQAQAQETKDEKALRNLSFTINYFQAALSALAELQPRLPNLTFSGEMTFYGSKRTARLIPFENGHTQDDLILYLPDEGIVFMGDLLFIDSHPYFPECDPDALQQILAGVRKLEAKIFVPGHGPVGMASGLTWMDRYINTLKGMVSEASQKGLSEEEIRKLAIPAEYQELIFPSFFSSNLKVLYDRLAKSSQA